MQPTPSGTNSAGDFDQLLLAARNGSSAALGALLEEYRAYLLLIANSELDADLRTKVGASDLVQESFLEAQRDFAGFQGADPDDLRAWLRRVLLHNLTDFARRFPDVSGRQISQDESQKGAAALLPRLADGVPSPSAFAIANELAAALLRDIENLPDDYRAVLTLRHQEERSFAEIGQTLNRTAPAARKLWFRAIERLRQDLKQGRTQNRWAHEAGRRHRLRQSACRAPGKL